MVYDLGPASMLTMCVCVGGGGGWIYASGLIQDILLG